MNVANEERGTLGDALVVLAEDMLERRGDCGIGDDVIDSGQVVLEASGGTADGNRPRRGLGSSDRT